jgi:hypothetical protein
MIVPGSFLPCLPESGRGAVQYRLLQQQNVRGSEPGIAVDIAQSLLKVARQG